MSEKSQLVLPGCSHHLMNERLYAATDTDPHPASTLRDYGLSLVQFDAFHPEPTRVSRLLSSIDLNGPISVSLLSGGAAPRLVAQINTPQGLRELS